MALVYYTSNPRTKIFDTYIRGYRNVPFIRNQYTAPTEYWKVTKVITRGNMLETMNIGIEKTIWAEIMPMHQQSAFDTGSVSWRDYNLGSLAYARAYGKFRAKVYDQAALMTAVAEYGSTAEMLLKRLLQLHTGVTHLKKGRFREFLKTYGLKPKPKHAHKVWSRPKDFGSLWLEYWMGWAPTIGDVYSCINALTQDLPHHTVRAGSRVPYAKKSDRKDGMTRCRCTFDGFVTVWVQADVSVTNPNLHLADSLGLLNPAKTVWEITPFSWFFDWFTNVGQVLGQFSDFAGVSLTNTIVAVKTVALGSTLCTGAQGLFGPAAPDTLWREYYLAGFSRTKVLSLPLIKPVFRLPNGLSITRGATLVSLLTTIFAPSKA